MDYLQNHCWCSSSHWDGEHYDCRHIVSLNSYGEGYKEDWEALIDEEAEQFFNRREFEAFSEYIETYEGVEAKPEHFMKHVPNLHPEVLKWLEENVADRPDKDSPKGWCVGSTEYRATGSSVSFSIFFHRRKDAMDFIRKFSKWKKPIHYCQYFKDIRKTLNLETGKYEVQG